ncbi:monovalent cation:proton antiporter-2 (CPA2) family protein [Sphingorhabdus sp. Alg239-R122]|uniref:monovalent cation:proton antiporter-2 (CPA2) family protein n=1 Tax=Sphingorhabdus sp. Alg239-R122 TaxID=2305989 RepID=UPI0013DBDDCE|nr:monovalent cation:proton antiporter-2 (CPA2) family protein [Sphingorhabdus sp. Alg239-R122]
MTDFLLLAFIFLIAGVIAVPIASRLGLGSVLGYLIAGIVISPTLSLLGVDIVAVQHFAEFGVVMMLFLVGLELEPKLLWEMRTRLLGLGGGQVLGTAALIMAAAMLLGQPWQMALAIGLVLALSSTAIVLQTLNEKGLMKSDGGQASFSVLLFQDIAVIPMLALLPLLAIPGLIHGGGAGHAESLSFIDGLNSWQTAVVTVGAIAFVVLGGNYLTRPIFRFIAAARLRELFTAAALMMIIGVALLMTLVGLSPALGTFLAGVILANSEYRHELESDIEPFKGLLLGLFFITVGAGINFALLQESFLPILALTLGLILLKAGVLLILGHIFKIPWASRWLFALGLAQAGEFGFVLLAFTVANGILPEALADQLLLVVALSMLLTPALFILYDRVIAPYFNRAQDREADEIEEQSHIIIAGRGRVGGIVDRMLEAAGFNATVIDFSSEQLGRLQAFGINAYFGDATRPDLLHSAGIAEAKVLVVAIDGKEQISKLVEYAVHHYPDLHVIARAVDRDHVYQLWALGCRDIIRETYDSSVRMGRSTFEALGISGEAAGKMSDVFWDLDRRSMIEFADVYDINILPHENDALIAKVRRVQEEWQPEVFEKMGSIMDKDKKANDKP